MKLMYKMTRGCDTRPARKPVRTPVRAPIPAPRDMIAYAAALEILG